MTKAIFYETVGGDLHRCMFAGLDNEGHAQWVVVDQGIETMTLSDYLNEFRIIGDIHLLCLEGEPLESLTLAILLGSVLQSYPIDCKKSLSDTIRKLRHMGIDWKHDTVDLKVYVFNYYDDIMDNDCFKYSILANGCEYLAELDAFISRKNLMNNVRSLFETLEAEAGIVLRKELVVDRSEIIEFESKDLLMFDKFSE